MFSKIVVISALLAVAFSAALQESEPIAIVSQKADMSPDGTFQWGYESADGTKQEQVGSIKQVDEESVLIIQGYSSWTDAEGVKHEMRYTADENGYHPEGADLPVAPAIPAEIVKSLERNAAAAAAAAQAEPKEKSKN